MARYSLLGDVQSVTGGLRVRGTAAATLYPALVAVELTLLSRVAYRDQEVTGPPLRGLLALLAGDLRTGCSTARLVEGLWPDEQSENPTKALQVLVSRARAQLGADVIATTPTGYQLALGRSATSSSWASPSSSSSPALGGSVRSREPGIGPARKISVNSASA